MITNQTSIPSYKAQLSAQATANFDIREAIAEPTPAPFDIRQAIEEHLPLVQRVARKAYRAFGCRFEHDDLVGYGHLGLVKACHKYAKLAPEAQQVTDLEKYIESRIWNGIAYGKDSMARIGRRDYGYIRRGQMEKPVFFSDGEDFRAVNQIAGRDPEPSLRHTKDAEAMLKWLRFINPLYAEVVELHAQGKPFSEIARITRHGKASVWEIYQRGMNELRWKYAPDTFAVASYDCQEEEVSHV